jgi:hypothetical protein
MAVEQGLCRLRQQAEAVDQLLLHVVQVLLRVAVREAFVDDEALVDVAAIVVARTSASYLRDTIVYAPKLTSRARSAHAA